MRRLCVVGVLMLVGCVRMVHDAPVDLAVDRTPPLFDVSRRDGAVDASAVDLPADPDGLRQVEAGLTDLPHDRGTTSPDLWPPDQGIVNPTCKSFSCTGAAQSFAVPNATTSLVVKAWGAGGGNASSGHGGHGGYASVTLAVTANETLTVIVGCGGQGRGHGNAVAAHGGFGGGGDGIADTVQVGADALTAGGGGGGRSALRRGTTELFTAGGGGGGSRGRSGGGGGGLVGGAGTGCCGLAGQKAAEGGTQNGGGAGSRCAGAGQAGGDGGPFLGGPGATGQGGKYAGGGGGGGYYGGGGGTGYDGSCGIAFGAAGGSSYIGCAGCTKGATAAATSSNPGNAGDALRGGAGQGGTAQSPYTDDVAGADGRLIVCW